MGCDHEKVEVIVPGKRRDALLRLLKAASFRLYDEQYANWTDESDRCILRDAENSLDRAIRLMESKRC